MLPYDVFCFRHASFRPMVNTRKKSFSLTMNLISLRRSCFCTRKPFLVLPSNSTSIGAGCRHSHKFNGCLHRGESTLVHPVISDKDSSFVKKNFHGNAVRKTIPLGFPVTLNSSTESIAKFLEWLVLWPSTLREAVEAPMAVVSVWRISTWVTDAFVQLSSVKNFDVCS